MIFIAEYVPSKQQDAAIAYQASSYYRSLHRFYDFLNYWGVIDVDDD